MKNFDKVRSELGKYFGGALYSCDRELGCVYPDDRRNAGH